MTTLREKILKQKSFVEADEHKNIIVHSIKIGGKKTYDDTVKITKSEQKKLLKLKTVDEFRQALYPLCRKDRLKIDSESEKIGLCKHARARQHCFNNVARAINRPEFVVEYGKPKDGKPKDGKEKAETKKKTTKKKAKKSWLA